MSKPLPPVRHTVVVEAPIDRAFQVFTAGFDKWWPRSHHIGKSDPEVFVIEEKEGGRCFERGKDGSECDWGRVRGWQPPERIVIAWHLNAAFQFDPDPAKASEVEVRFIRESEKRTRVELEHRHFERHGEGAEKVQASVGNKDGWPGIMDLYRGVASS
jgi:uncharacterized protein YndB with AHSA1/START domain